MGSRLALAILLLLCVPAAGQHRVVLKADRPDVVAGKSPTIWQRHAVMGWAKLMQDVNFTEAGECTLTLDENVCAGWGRKTSEHPRVLGQHEAGSVREAKGSLREVQEEVSVGRNGSRSHHALARGRKDQRGELPDAVQRRQSKKIRKMIGVQNRRGDDGVTRVTFSFPLSHL
jgi:hypothetical protein